jgi:hypothetical protein
MVVTWTANGAARLELAINHGDEVWLASFANTQFDAGGWAVLDLAGEPPWLQMIAPGGSIEAPSGAIAASAFTKLSVEASWLPTPTPWPSETPWLPTETSIPTAPPRATHPAAAPALVLQLSATPVQTAAPGATQPVSAASRPSIGCPSAVALPMMLIGFLGLRKMGRKRM